MSDPRNAWNKCHKLKGRNNKVPNMVDGAIGDENISRVFSNKYNALLNSVGVDSEKLELLKSTVETDLSNSGIDFNISYKDVSDSLKNLASGKSDGHLGIYSDHILYGTEKLTYYITVLFNCMLSQLYTK